MRDEVKRDLNHGNKAFKEKVLPVLLKEEYFESTNWTCVEGSEDDYLYGIDWFYVRDKKRYNVSVRVQQGTEYKFRTFTTRLERDNGSKTEFIKIYNAIHSEGRRPMLTLHAYLKGDWDSEFDYGAIASTKKIFEAYQHLHDIKLRRADSEQFIYAPWEKVKGVFIF